MAFLIFEEMILWVIALFPVSFRFIFNLKSNFRKKQTNRDRSLLFFAILDNKFRVKEAQTIFQLKQCLITTDENFKKTNN